MPYPADVLEHSLEHLGLRHNDMLGHQAGPGMKLELSLPRHHATATALFFDQLIGGAGTALSSNTGKAAASGAGAGASAGLAFKACGKGVKYTWLKGCKPKCKGHDKCAGCLDSCGETAALAAAAGGFAGAGAAGLASHAAGPAQAPGEGSIGNRVGNAVGSDAGKMALGAAGSAAGVKIQYDRCSARCKGPDGDCNAQSEADEIIDGDTQSQPTPFPIDQCIGCWDKCSYKAMGVSALGAAGGVFGSRKAGEALGSAPQQDMLGRVPQGGDPRGNYGIGILDEWNTAPFFALMQKQGPPGVDTSAQKHRRSRHFDFFDMGFL